MGDDNLKCSEDICAVVSLTDLLRKIIYLKKRAVEERDKELYNVADSLEHEMKLLMDKNNLFERW